MDDKISKMIYILTTVISGYLLKRMFALYTRDSPRQSVRGKWGSLLAEKMLENESH